MTRIKRVVWALSQTFPELVFQPEDSTEVVVQWVTDMVEMLHVKFEEMGARLAPTTPPEVYEESKF